MLSRLGIEVSQVAQYVIAFAIILVLVALFGLVLRRVTGGRLVLPGQDRARARQPRLGIVDIYDLDRQRQLILLRRDNVEHLLLIGGPNDVVVENNIVRVPGARLSPATGEPAAERPEPSFERAPEAVARPQVESQGRPSLESQLAARLGALVNPPAETSDADREPAPIGSAGGRAPARVEPTLKPDAVTPSPPRMGKVEPVMAPARPAPAPTPPEPPALRPEPRPVPHPAATSPRPVPPPRPAPPPAPEPRVTDTGVLSDMAKQLEQALKRPTGPASGPQPSPPPPPPARKPEREEDGDLLVPSPPASPRPSAPGAPSAPPAAQTASPNEAPRPATEPVRPAPPSPAPAPPTTPPRAAPPPPPPVPAAQPARPADDPFSVEEIEAEFARLLGRPVDKDKT